MDVIWNYLKESPILLIVLILVVGLIFSWFSSPRKGEVRQEDLVPHYRRFERREPELGNRRKDRADAKAKAKTEAEQRKMSRRSRD